VLDGKFDQRLSSLTEGWWSSEVTGTGVVVPDGAVDLMWAQGRVPWVAGPDTVPRPVELTAGTVVVGIRLKPGVACAVLGCAVAEATDQSVPLTSVWPRAVVEQLGQALAAARSMEHAAHDLAAALRTRVETGWSPDPVAVEAIASIRSGRSVDTAGLSDRQFRRRFTATAGYGPSFYRRVVRLDRFSDLVEQHPHRSMAELAALAGYHDESHLCRDSRQLTGRSPAMMRSVP